MCITFTAQSTWNVWMKGAISSDVSFKSATAKCQRCSKYYEMFCVMLCADSGCRMAHACVYLLIFGLLFFFSLLSSSCLAIAPAFRQATTAALSSAHRAHRRCGWKRAILADFICQPTLAFLHGCIWNACCCLLYHWCHPLMAARAFSWPNACENVHNQQFLAMHIYKLVYATNRWFLASATYPVLNWRK